MPEKKGERGDRRTQKGVRNGESKQVGKCHGNPEDLEDLGEKSGMWSKWGDVDIQIHGRRQHEGAGVCKEQGQVHVCL